MAIGNAAACLYIRGRKREQHTGPQLIPDSFWERFGSNTAVVSRDARGEYHVTTYADLGRQKRERQEGRLRDLHAEAWRVQRRPLYVWVFHCPGLGGFAFGGWWTYLIGRGISEGRWSFHDEQLQRRLMTLFPIAAGSLDGPPLTYEQWMPLFARVFCCRNPDGKSRKHAGRIQGKALIWAEVRGDHVERIIGRARWPLPRGGSVGSMATNHQ